MILVTGSNSLLGATLIEKLAAAGQTVRALDLDPPRRAADGVEYRVGNLLDEEFLSECCNGVEVVFHLRDVKGPGRHGRRFMRRMNIKAVKRILEASRAAGVRRFVFLSSYEVYGSQKNQPISEQAACHPATRFGSHKHKAERLCREANDPDGMEVVVVRPAPVIGPGTNNPVALITLLMALGMEEANRIYVAGDGENRFQLLHPEDAAEALIAMMQKPGIGGKVFNLGADEVPTQMEQVRTVVERARLDAAVMHLSSGRARFLSKVLRPFRINYLNKGHVMYLLTNMILDCSAAKDELGWSPKRGNLDIILETVDWYRREKL